MIKILLPLVLILPLSACLRTRSELSGVRQKVTEEQRKAQFDLRFQEVDTQMRHLYGRIEAMESAFRQRSETQKKVDEQRQESEREIWARIKLLEQTIDQRNQRKPPPPKSAFDLAQGHFEARRWRNAALEFEKYRSKNPKGKYYISATYKIGVCFEELGEKDNARLFYEEIIKNHPQHHIAKKARYRLKKLK